MAETGTILRQLMTEASDSGLSAPSYDSMEKSKPLDILFADAECAETLIQLSLSHSSLEHTEMETNFSKTNPFRRLSSIDSIESDASFSSDETESADETDNMLHRQQILKHIQMDHNYFWSGSFQNIDEIFWDETKYSDDKKLEKKCIRKKKRASVSKPDNNKNMEDCSNLHMLLKCVIEREKLAINQNNSRINETEAMESIFNDEESLSDVSPSDIKFNFREGSYVCILCSRHFSKKRYLTKHMQRMHSESTCSVEGSIACTMCGQYILPSEIDKSLNLDLCIVCSKKLKDTTKDLQPRQQESDAIFTDFPVQSEDSSASLDHSRCSDYQNMSEMLSSNKTNELQTKLIEKNLADKVVNEVINCQFCGLQVPRFQHVNHLTQVHCTGPTRGSIIWPHPDGPPFVIKSSKTKQSFDSLDDERSLYPLIDNTSSRNEDAMNPILSELLQEPGDTSHSKSQSWNPLSYSNSGTILNKKSHFVK